MRKIGILAIHGDVAEHAAALRKLKLEPVEVRAPKDFAGLSGLILPGGESTTISDLAKVYGLEKALIKFATTPSKPIFGTCAGLILLAKLGLLKVEAERNAYGRQLDSFEANLAIPVLAKKKFPGIFIRAPKITKTGQDVEVLSKFEKSPVFVRQKSIWAASFHPELTDDLRIQKLIFGN